MLPRMTNVAAQSKHKETVPIYQPRRVMGPIHFTVHIDGMGHLTGI